MSGFLSRIAKAFGGKESKPAADPTAFSFDNPMMQAKQQNLMAGQAVGAFTDTKREADTAKFENASKIAAAIREEEAAKAAAARRDIAEKAAIARADATKAAAAARAAAKAIEAAKIAKTLNDATVAQQSAEVKAREEKKESATAAPEASVATDESTKPIVRVRDADKKPVVTDAYGHDTIVDVSKDKDGNVLITNTEKPAAPIKADMDIKRPNGLTKPIAQKDRNGNDVVVDASGNLTKVNMMKDPNGQDAFIIGGKFTLADIAATPKERSAAVAAPEAKEAAATKAPEAKEAVETKAPEVAAPSSPLSLVTSETPSREKTPSASVTSVVDIKPAAQEKVTLKAADAAISAESQVGQAATASKGKEAAIG